MITDTSSDRQSLAASVADGRPGLELVREQVDRILASDTFRASEVLRRLLKFLVRKTLSGEADHLKEYTIGLDALGKPSTYDPSRDAVVRLQASRLRQKLDDYYRNEGKNDPLVIELPKGGFKIAWHDNAGDTLSVITPVAPAPTIPSSTAISAVSQAIAAVSPVAATVSPVTAPAPAKALAATDPPHLKRWRNLAIGFAATSLALACLCVWPFVRTSRPLVASPASAGLTPELDALWHPFFSSAHHLIIGFPNPLFIRLQRPGNPDIVYRTRGNYTWDEATNAPEFSAFSKLLGNPAAIPSFHLVERSCLFSTFALSQFLARRIGDISLARSSDLSWQEFADNDVILLTALKLGEGQSALPVRPTLTLDRSGVRNLEPRAGEPALYADPPGHQESNGEGLELISMLPGPLGRTTVVTFESNHAWGLIGGVRALTDPAFARVLTQTLRQPSGKIAPYYQIVLRISYRDGTPTNVSYITHRVLTMTENSTEPSARLN